MTEVSVRELANNLSAVLARAEQGEVITVTRRGKAIVRVGPEQEEAGRYAALAASGNVRFRPRKDSAGRPYPRYDIASDRDPLDVLLDMREADDR